MKYLVLALLFLSSYAQAYCHIQLYNNSDDTILTEEIPAVENKQRCFDMAYKEAKAYKAFTIEVTYRNKQ